MRKVKGSEKVLYFFGDDTWRRIKKSAVRYKRKGSPLSSSFFANSAQCPAPIHSVSQFPYQGVNRNDETGTWIAEANGIVLGECPTQYEAVCLRCRSEGEPAPTIEEFRATAASVGSSYRL